MFSNLMKDGWDLPDTMTPKKLDKQVDYFYKRATDALDMASPLRPESRSLTSNVWFTDELLRMQQKVQRLYRCHLRERTPEAEVAYICARKKYRAACKKARVASWRKFTSFTPDEHSMAKLADLVQHREKKTLGSLLKEDGTVTVDGTETLEVLA